MVVDRRNWSDVLETPAVAFGKHLMGVPAALWGSRERAPVAACDESRSQPRSPGR